MIAALSFSRAISSYHGGKIGRNERQSIISPQISANVALDDARIASKIATEAIGKISYQPSSALKTSLSGQRAKDRK